MTSNYGMKFGHSLNHLVDRQSSETLAETPFRCERCNGATIPSQVSHLRTRDGPRVDREQHNNRRSMLQIQNPSAIFLKQTSCFLPKKRPMRFPTNCGPPNPIGVNRVMGPFKKKSGLNEKMGETPGLGEIFP